MLEGNVKVAWIAHNALSLNVYRRRARHVIQLVRVERSYNLPLASLLGTKLFSESDELSRLDVPEGDEFRALQSWTLHVEGAVGERDVQRVLEGEVGLAVATDVRGSSDLETCSEKRWGQSTYWDKISFFETKTIICNWKQELKKKSNKVLKIMNIVSKYNIHYFWSNKFFSFTLRFTDRSRQVV